MRRRPLPILVLALSACLAACGGGSSSDDHGDPPTRSDFAARADAICRQEQDALNNPIDAVAADFERASSQEELDQAADEARVVVSRERAGLDRLRELPRPRGEAKAIATMLSVAYAQTRESRMLATAAETGDELELEAVGGRVKANAGRYERLAEPLGLLYCGHPH